MKKLLAMALAIATVASYAIVGASAAEFKDESSITHKEAVQVLNATGVLIGDNNGNFNPSGALDRASAAKIIAYLDIGERSAESMPEQQIFDDVPASHWASKYIGYCYTAGYISGDGQGHFFPDQQLDSYSFGKMLQTLLGYDAEIEGLVGEQWKLKIAALSSRIGLTDDVNKVGSEVLTREEGARMALNALKANMVEYSNKGTTISVGDGATVSVGASSASPQYSTENYATSIKNDEDDNRSQTYGRILQLGEKLYKGDLKLNEIDDELGRKTDQWVWKSETVGEYPSTPDEKVVVSKQNQKLSDVIGDVNSRYKFNEDDATASNRTEYFVSGIKQAVAVAGDIGNDIVQQGAVVEFSMKDGKNGTANEVDRISVYYYDSAEVDGDVTTKGSGSSLEVRVPGVYSGYVKADKVTGYEGLKDDDIVYFTVGKSNNAAGGDDVYHIYKANKLESQMTRVKATSGSTPAKYVINGTDYMVNAGPFELHPTTAIDDVWSDTFDEMDDEYNTQYAYYLDDNNFIVYAKKLEESSTNFSALENVYMEFTSGGTIATVYARVVHQDGVVEVRPLKKIEMDNNVTYEKVATTQALMNANHNLAYNDTSTTPYTDGVNSDLIDMCAKVDVTTDYSDVNLFAVKVNSSGEFELKQAHANNDKYLVRTGEFDNTLSAGTKKLDPSTGSMPYGANSSFNVNNSTVFVVRKNMTDTNENPTYLVYTGKNNAPSFTVNPGNVVHYAAAVKDSIASVVYVYEYDVKSASGKSIFVVSDSNVGRQKVGDDNKDLWSVIRDGQLVDIPVDPDTSDELAYYGGIAEIVPSYNEDGVMDDFETTEGNVSLWAGKESVKEEYALEGKYGNQRFISPIYARFTDVAYGYKVDSGSLLVGKTYGKSSYEYSFDISSTTPIVYKNTDGVYTLGTLADVSNKDDNDQIYVICTDDDMKTVKYALIVERDGDNADLARAYYYVAADATIIDAGDPTYNGSIVSFDFGGAASGHTNFIVETEAGVKIVSTGTGVTVNEGNQDSTSGQYLGLGHVWEISITGTSGFFNIRSTDDPDGNDTTVWIYK